MNQILIVGFGRSGRAAAELALLKGYRVTVLEQLKPKEVLLNDTLFEQPGVQLATTIKEARVIPFEQVVISPGIKIDEPLRELFKGVKVESELNFAAKFCFLPILAITGTNGKTTTTELVTHLLNSNGIRALAAGNIGLPFSEAVMTQACYDFFVVEVSSFQLEKSPDFVPEASVLLNISSDHMDRYPSIEAYALTKERLLMNTVNPQKRYISAETVARFPMLDTPAMTFSAYGATNADYYIDSEAIWSGPLKTADLPALQLQGAHNRENILAAVLLAQNAGLSMNQLIPQLKDFAPADHRLQSLGKFGELEVINDSKSTNPDSLIRALLAMAEKSPEKVVLIAGGLDKEMDFSETVPYIGNYVKSAILIGETKTKLKKIWENQTACYEFSTLSEAVEGAIDMAGTNSIILFSPGCASMDMFTNYVQRGQQFCTEIERRLGNEK